MRVFEASPLDLMRVFEASPTAEVAAVPSYSLPARVLACRVSSLHTRARLSSSSNGVSPCRIGDGRPHGLMRASRSNRSSCAKSAAARLCRLRLRAADAPSPSPMSASKRQKPSQRPICQAIPTAIRARPARTSRASISRSFPYTYLDDLLEHVGRAGALMTGPANLLMCVEIRPWVEAASAQGREL